MDIESLLTLGIEHNIQGKTAEALECFSEIIRSGASSSIAYLYRASIRLEMGDYSGAIEDCSWTIKIDEESGISTDLSANSKYLLSKWFPEIKEWFSKIKEGFPENKDLIPTTLIMTESHSAYSVRGNARYELGDFIGAIEDSIKAIQLNTFNIDAYITLGLAYGEIEELEHAINCFNKVIEIKPKNHQLYFFRANAKLRLRDYRGAIEDCNTCIELDRDYEFGWLTRAFGNIGLENIEQAVMDVNMGLSVGSHSAGFYCSCGLLFYLIKRDLEKSICCLRIAVIKDSENAEYLFKLANYYSEWEHKNIVDEAFFLLLGSYGDKCKNLFVDEIAFNERKSIAQGFYSQTFRQLLPYLRTDLKDEREYFTLYLFIGNANHCLDLLSNKEFFFADVRTFPDVTDCALLHPINQSNLAVRVSYDNIRIRCLCDCEFDGENGIEKCVSAWDRHANGHRGIAYKLRIEKDWLTANGIYLNKISYKEGDLEIGCESPEQVIQDGLYKKVVDYRDEREWRMIKFGDFEEGKGIKVPFDYDGKKGVTIAAIYLGMNMSDDLRKIVSNKATDENIDLHEMWLAKNGVLKCSASSSD